MRCDGFFLEVRSGFALKLWEPLSELLRLVERALRRAPGSSAIVLSVERCSAFEARYSGF